MRKITIHRVLFGKDITAKITILDYGVNILLTGGDLTHIGAVSMMSDTGEFYTIQFMKHKEAVLSEKWVKEIYKRINAPVIVEAGIHYDDIVKEQIDEIVITTDYMLEETINYLISL